MPFPHTLELPHGRLDLPVFMPDATRGVVRSADNAALQALGVQALVMSLFHLLQRPGPGTLKAAGGLHRMFGWELPLVTDSGGFQAYSLIHQNPTLGSISDQGLVFKGESGARPLRLTPEKVIQHQVAFDSDVVICLDDCTHPDAPLAEQRSSVRRTIAWAKRCKREFERLMAERRVSGQRPLLLGVIQGGAERELRRECAEELLALGFDGYGLGGWPLDSQGELLRDIIAYLRDLVPAQYPLHALGVGHPKYILECAALGYNLFDSAMPTRDARHGRLLCWQADAGTALQRQSHWYSYLYIGDDVHRRDRRPLDEGCPCPTCTHYSRAWLHHLFKIGDTLYERFATLHNIAFIMRLMERIRHEQPAG
ncbi:MAG: tRNA-ribosyltransferase family protein [Anaerolineae bacterium]